MLQARLSFFNFSMSLSGHLVVLGCSINPFCVGSLCGDLHGFHSLFISTMQMSMMQVGHVMMTVFHVGMCV
jgi:hypothetical protein